MIKQVTLSVLLLASVVSSSYAYRPSGYVDKIWIDEGERIVSIEPDADKALTLNGWTRRGRGEVYRVKVKAGDRLRLELFSKSEYLLMAVFDFATPDDEAIFFSELNNRKTTLRIQKDTELLIRPILILGQPRRGLGANYQLHLERLTSKATDQSEKSKTQGSKQ